MKKLLSSDKIYIGKSRIPKAGRGVYARGDIKKGEIIEECPLIEVPENDLSNLSQSTLVTYFFYLGKNKERPVIALGFGSIYNHSYEPNARHKINALEKTLDFIALKNIIKDDEITVNYNPKQKRKSPLWFEKLPILKKS